MAESAVPIRRAKPQLQLFIPWACRFQPACAIAMKECPGPRSGIDRCGSLSFAIRGIPSPFAASLRHSRHPFVNPAPHSSFRRRPESRGEGWHQPHPNTSNDQASFSYLGVPAAAGMRDWYENSYPLPRNSSFSRKRESRGEGWHQPHPNTSNDQVSFSYLGVPAPAGMGDWYENSYPLPPNSSFRRRPESRGEGWHQPRPNTSNDQVSFSYLGAPAPVGMDDRYENRLPPPVSSFQRKLESRRGGVGDRDEDVDDGAAPVGRNAAACLLGPWLGTSPSATFLPFHCQMLIHGSGKIGWPA